MRKLIRRSLIALPLLLVAYLAIVALWANAAIGPILQQHPVAAIPVRLTPEQSARLLMIEDPTFYRHRGLSLANGQGATTITSSLARDVFLFRSDLDGTAGVFQRFYRAVFACCRKVDLGRDVTALVLDVHLDKERQLALFVDQVYMGRHDGVQLRGLGPAAQALFGKPLAALSDAEFAGLIGMIKSPNDLHPTAHADAYRHRAARVLAVASGRCSAAGWFDTEYEQCGAVLPSATGSSSL